MKLLFLVVLIGLFFCSTPVYAQHAPQQELDSIHNRNYRNQDSLLTLYKAVSAQLDTATAVSIRRSLKEKRDSLDKAIEQSWQNRIQSEFAFVRCHPALSQSLDILNFYLRRPEGFKCYDTIHALYRKLSKTLRNSLEGKQLKDALAYCKSSEVGKEAPDFKVKDINGRPLTLSSFRHKKYVLLDFWASWCVPCGEEFPYLKRKYEAYRSKGLEIISASIDQSVEAWRMAVRKDSIDRWKHFAVK